MGNLGPRATVFQGEVFAIQKAAEWLLAEGGTDPVHFYIDSQAAITAILNVDCLLYTSDAAEILLV